MCNYDLERFCVDYLTWPRSILTRLPDNCRLDSYRLWNGEVRDCALSSIPSTININVTPLKAVLLIPAGFWREDITCICVLISDLRFLFTQTIPLMTMPSWFLWPVMSSCDATSSWFNFLISVDVKTCRRSLIVWRLRVFRMMMLCVGDFSTPPNFVNQVSTTVVPQCYQRKQSDAH